MQPKCCAGPKHLQTTCKSPFGQRQQQASPPNKGSRRRANHPQRPTTRLPIPDCSGQKAPLLSFLSFCRHLKHSLADSSVTQLGPAQAQSAPAPTARSGPKQCLQHTTAPSNHNMEPMEQSDAGSIDEDLVCVACGTDTCPEQLVICDSYDLTARLASAKAWTQPTVLSCSGNNLRPVDMLHGVLCKIAKQAHRLSVSMATIAAHEDHARGEGWAVPLWRWNTRSFSLRGSPGP